MSARAVVCVLVLAACTAPDDLADGELRLPRELREVSGIVAVDAHTLACVQDEVGAVFFVDLRGGRAPRVVPFGPRGDYEGIAWTGSELWVLRSDCALLRLQEREGGLEVAATYRLPAAAEYEGLCHDASRHRLLVMPKGPTDADRHGHKELRRVFAFDLDAARVLPEPVLTLDRDAVAAAVAAAAGGRQLPRKTTAKGHERVELGLAGSEVATVPGSDDLLVLVAADHLLLRFTPRGELVGVRVLPTDGLPQAEAMTFLADGRLVVASEGRGGPARLRVVELP